MVPHVVKMVKWVKNGEMGQKMVEWVNILKVKTVKSEGFRRVPKHFF